MFRRSIGVDSTVQESNQYAPMPMRVWPADSILNTEVSDVQFDGQSLLFGGHF
jgi:hypothetical protein